jgi:UDP-3-O-[3-hydroxymyristoyl] N-acetylglucosamine deacetylase
VLRGIALHRGGPAEVRLSQCDGPIVVAQRGAEAPLDELRPVRTDRGVTVATEDGRVRVDLIEHLLAAFGGLGIREGMRVEVGDELPLLDGGALAFAEALHELGLAPERLRPLRPLRPCGPPDPETARAQGTQGLEGSLRLCGSILRIRREAVLEHGRSVYRFTPGTRVELRVEVDFPAPVGRGSAAWAGDADDFVARIAPARTFGWASELAALRAAGRASEVDLDAVLVFDERGPLPGCRPPGPDEPARHKLLDLVGDLALHGGPPLGLIEAALPGHGATHAIVARALAAGVLAREGAR